MQKTIVLESFRTKKVVRLISKTCPVHNLSNKISILSRLRRTFCARPTLSKNKKLMKCRTANQVMPRAPSMLNNLPDNKLQTNLHVEVAHQED